MTKYKIKIMKDGHEGILHMSYDFMSIAILQALQYETLYGVKTDIIMVRDDVDRETTEDN